MVRLELPATYAELSVLSSAITALLDPIEQITDRERVVYAVQLAAHEICTNIIDHAYAGATDKWIKATLRLAPATRKLEIELEDSGIACNPDSIADPDLSQPRESGYGMYLVRNLVDDVCYTRIAGGNRWTLVKQV